MTTLSSRVWAVGLLAVSAIAGWAGSEEASTGLALLSVATIPALFAVPPRGRPALGVVVAGCGVVAAALGDLGGSVAAWVSVVTLVVAGVVTALRGSTWSRLGRRYDDGHVDEHLREPVDLWRALDKGEDPTVGDSPEADGGKRPRDADQVD